MQAHICGFPAIGRNRELKRALESFWKEEASHADLLKAAAGIRKDAWSAQSMLDYVVSGDFSLYDRMLDTTLWLGAIPKRFATLGDDSRARLYFGMARGDASARIAALEMTKWFDTNYHYLVPELGPGTVWQPAEHPVLTDTRAALELGFLPKPAIIGPFTWLALSKGQAGVDKWRLLPSITERYAQLCSSLAQLSPPDPD